MTKLHYGIRSSVALSVGFVLAILWTALIFGGGSGSMPRELHALAWLGVQRVVNLTFLGIAIAVCLFFVNLRVDLASIGGNLADRVKPFASIPDRFLNSESIHFGLKAAAALFMIAFMLVIVYPTLLIILWALFSPAIMPFVWLAQNVWQKPLSDDDLPRAVWSFVTAENTKSLLWIYFKALFIGYVLLFGPAKWVRFCEGLREHHLFRRIFIRGKGGSARWAGPRSYEKRSGFGFSTNDSTGARARGVFIGRTQFLDAGTGHGEYVGFEDDSHMLTIGCQGSGKSATAICSNLALSMAGVFCLDPKGEHARRSYWRRTRYELAKGKCNFTKVHLPSSTDRYSNYHANTEAFKLDPFNQEPSIPGACYNPLSEVDINHDRVRERLAAISDGCVMPEGDRNRHWTEGAKTILEGFMAHVLSVYPKENHNLPFVHDLLVEFDPEIGVADPKRLDELIIQMRGNNAAGGLCAQAASLLGERKGESYGNMIITVQRSIKWIGDPAMRKHLVGNSGFEFRRLPAWSEKVAGQTVYVVSPLGPLMKEQVRWLRVLTNLGITIVRQQSFPPVRTLFILDEFPQLGGQLSAISEGIVTLRSAGVKLWPFIQQIGQMREYGQAWNTFISSSNVQAFGITDPETAGWLSDFLGEYMHVRKEEKRIVHEGTRPLWTPREVMEELGKFKPTQLVLPNDGGFPMRLERVAYKPLTFGGQAFRGMPELRGHFEEEP